MLGGRVLNVTDKTPSLASKPADVACSLDLD
jgi:hypothetical protein